MSPAKASSLHSTDAISKGRDPPCKSVAQSPSSKISSRSSLYFTPPPSKFPLLLTEEGCGKYSLRDRRGSKLSWSLMGGACKTPEAGAFPLRTSISSPVKWENNAQLKGGRPRKLGAKGEGSIRTRMMCPGAHSPFAPLSMALHPLVKPLIPEPWSRTLLLTLGVFSSSVLTHQPKPMKTRRFLWAVSWL